MAAAGHEIGVHGWDHRPVALHSPRSLRDGIARTRDLVEDATGRPVTWYRPPYGMVTLVSWWAARAVGLDTVLWSAWGRDWERAATRGVGRAGWSSASCARAARCCCTTPTGPPRPDHGAPPSVATERLVSAWRATGVDVGPLAEHWPERRRESSRE